LAVKPKNHQILSEKLLESWQKRIIDTTKRNVLLNFKPTKTRHFQLVCEDFDYFFNKINEQRNRIIITWAENPPLLQGQKNTIRIILDKSDYYHKLRFLYRESRKIIAETSINILYLATGFICYSDKKKDRTYRAPLLLIPAKLSPVKKSLGVIYRELANDQKPFLPRTFFQLSLDLDEIITNPALKHVFIEDYNIEIPEYSNEFSIKQYFNEILPLTINSDDFSVDKDIYLGFYSYHTFTLYQDIEKHMNLIIANPLFQRIAGISREGNDSRIINTDDLDEIEKPLETFHVLDADSSQRKAIMMAEKGASFILQGPPGTGKSQTIANIIAEFIANGKKILFVSEKRAALDVVFKRLSETGLEDYLLDLHSIKQTKRDFYRKIGESLNSKISREWKISKKVKQRLMKLTKLRTKLNRMALLNTNTIAPFNCSLYDLFGRVAVLNDIPNLDWVPAYSTISNKNFNNDIALLEQLIQFKDVFQAYRSSIWRCYKKTVYDQITRSQLDNLISISNNLYHDTRKIWNELSKYTGFFIPPSGLSISTISCWIEYFNYYIHHEIPLPLSWMMHPKITKKGSEALDIHTISNNLIQFTELSRFFDEKYNQGVFELPLNYFKTALETKYSRWWKRLFRRENYRNIEKSVAEFSKINKYSGAISYSELLADIRNLLTYKYLQEWKDTEEESIRNILDDYYNGEKTDWEKVRNHMDMVRDRVRIISEIREWLVRYGIDKVQQYTEKGNGPEIDVQMIQAQLSLCFTKDPSSIHVKEVIKPVEKAYRLKESLNELISLLSEIFELETPSGELTVEQIGNIGKNIQLTINNALSFFKLRQITRKFNGISLGDFFDEFSRRGIPVTDIVGAYIRQVYMAVINHYLENLPEELISGSRDQDISSFIELDQESIRIAPYRIHEKAEKTILGEIGWLPRSVGETGFLLREYEKKRMHKPIRVAFRRAPKKILQVKPVLFLSPLSISYFLDPELITFDLAIFDEASQIRPEQAVGAFIRSKQVIIVGDSKQMPPTNFFSAKTGGSDFNGDVENSDEDDWMDDVPDKIVSRYNAESILEALNLTSIHSLQLRYHYRSKHESLIAFSNKMFYENNLVTFPSPLKNMEKLGLELVLVEDGIYDRGKTRTNVREAKKVVEIVERLLSEEKHPSIGIVAFSQAQERAIEKEIERNQRLDELLDDLMEEEEDPFFVKNLETVQGDERDIIIISIGYGKDDKGRFYQNLGPVTKAGGERRLLISRARRKIYRCWRI